MEQSPSIELEIQRLLKKSVPSEVAKDILRGYDWNSLKKEELRSLFQFFILSGQGAVLLEHLKPILKKDTPLPWDLFFDICYKNYSGFQATHFKVIQIAAENQNAVQDLALHPEVGHFSTALEKTKKDLVFYQQEKVEEKKKELFNLLTLFQSQGLFEKAEELLKRIYEYFPDDPEVQSKTKKNTEKKLSEFFESQISRNRKKYFSVPQASAEETQMLEQIFISTNAILQNKENEFLFVDFVVMFLMLDGSEWALKLTETKLNTYPWLHAEVLLACHRNLEVLHFLNELKNQVTEDPDSQLQVFYYQAIASYNLGQIDFAVEILESLIKKNPEFRSAANLLDTWRADQP